MQQGAELFGATYRRGEIIFRQDDPGDAMYIIQSGAVEVSQRINGQETVIAILEKGDFFGEMTLLKNDHRSATVTAISRTRLIPLTKDLLVDRLKRDPDVCMHLLKKLIERIHRGHRRYRRELRENDRFKRAITAQSADILTNGQKPPAIEPVDLVTDASHAAQRLLGFPLAAPLSADRRHVETGRVVFREGDPGKRMYVIISGSVGVSKCNRDQTCLIDTIGPGDFFGEMALITDMPRSATVTSLEPTDLIAIDKDRFLDSMQDEPQLAMAIIETLILRLIDIERLLANPGHLRSHQWTPWVPESRKPNRLSLSIVSLSTCAGCSAVMLDQTFLSDMLSIVSIKYCQMLMDQRELPDSDVILIDGVVRLKEDERKLIEARRRSRHLVAWGTCAAFAGIPALANRFEVEAVIEESYGSTDDALSYYFSGSSGVDSACTYQLNGIELQRRAFAIDSFVKVDTYLPGCPPSPSLLLGVLQELTGVQTPRTEPIVCASCGRKPARNTDIKALRAKAVDKYCFNSMGRLCLGFMIRGGCDAACPTSGVPCWGCRGPSKKTIKGLQTGNTLEEIARQGFRKRHVHADDRLKNTIKKFRQAGHFIFDIDGDAADKLLRIK